VLWRIALVIVLLGGTARAQASEEIAGRVWDAVEEIGRRDRRLDALISLGYLAVHDPETLRHLPARLYGDLLREIDRDPVLRAIAINTRDLYRGGYVRLDLDAGATTDLDVPAAATASIDAAWELPLCTVLGGAASGLVGYGDGDALASYAATVRGCLPLPANTIEVGYSRRNNVRASVLARPVTFTERRTSDLVEIDLRFYRWRGSRYHVDISPIEIDIEHSVDRQGEQLGAWTSSVSIAPVAWRRRGKGLLGADQVFRVMHVHFWDLQNDGSSVFTQAGHIAPLVIDGIHLADHATFGADVGWAIAGTYQGSGATAMPILDAGGVHADVHVDTVLASWATRVRASHTWLPLFDGQLVRDSRLEVHAQREWQPATLRVTGFVARQQVFRELPGDRTLLVGGGAADAAWSLGRGVLVYGRVEVARALLAGLASDPVQATREVRATVGVNAHYELRWPRR